MIKTYLYSTEFGKYDKIMASLISGDNTEFLDLDLKDFNIEYISKYMFRSTNLRSISLPEKVISISQSAFENCSSLESIVIPDSVLEIGPSAFKGCSSLKSITVPFIGKNINSTVSSNTAHFGYIFGAFSADGNDTNVPESLETVIVTNGTNILGGSFRGCFYIKNVTLPTTIKDIETRAFYSCYALENINISDSILQDIEREAFGYCTSLKTITLPATIRSIGSYAFYMCESLENVIFKGTVSQISNAVIADDAFLRNKYNIYSMFRWYI